jgi:hypothetical protein
VKSLWCWILRRPGRIVLALILLLPAVGCSSKAKGTVFGKVTYQGKPLPGGQVDFILPNASGGGSSRIDPKDGSYRIENLSRGTMKVIVQPYREPPNPFGMAGGPPGGKIGGPPPGALPEGVDPKALRPWENAGESGAQAVTIPFDYMQADKTPLECTVQGGSEPQEFNINLEELH